MIIEEILIENLGISKLQAQKLEEMILEALVEDCPNFNECGQQYVESHWGD